MRSTSGRRIFLRRGLAFLRGELATAFLAVALIVFDVGILKAQTSGTSRTSQMGMPAVQSQSQASNTLVDLSPYTLLQPPSHDEVADEDRVSWSLKKLPAQPYMREFYWENTPGTPAFFRDSLLQVVARTYYLTRDNSDGSKSQAWAGGGWIAFRSGLIGDVFGIHVAGYTSQPLFAPDGEGGTKLLTPDQGALNSLGQAYARFQIIDQEFRAGRQLVDTPLINPQDSRMVPNTFEGITLTSLPDKDRFYDYTVGFLSAVKQRDSNEFVTMSETLPGGDDVGEGTVFGMVKVRPFSGFTAVLEDYTVPSFFNTGFIQGEYDFKQPKDRPNWILGANLIDQRSFPESQFVAAMPFSTYQASGKVQMTYVGWTAFIAGSATGDQSKIYSPFGSKPNYTDMQQVSFDNAGEKAFGASIAYDLGYAFGKYGLSGFSVGVWDTQGWGALNPATGAAIADRNELDLWLQYRPSSGPLQGFRFKTQYASVWQSGNIRNPQPELRVILDYTILLRPPISMQ
jgi:outer membrane porin, OprD family